MGSVKPNLEVPSAMSQLQTMHFLRRDSDLTFQSAHLPTIEHPSDIKCALPEAGWPCMDTH